LVQALCSSRHGGNLIFVARIATFLFSQCGHEEALRPAVRGFPMRVCALYLTVCEQASPGYVPDFMRKPAGNGGFSHCLRGGY
jgi:hypothetical protein